MTKLKTRMCEEAFNLYTNTIEKSVIIATNEKVRLDLMISLGSPYPADQQDAILSCDELLCQEKYLNSLQFEILRQSNMFPRIG